MNYYLFTYIIAGLTGSTKRAELKAILKAGNENEASRVFDSNRIWLQYPGIKEGVKNYSFLFLF